MVSRAMEVSEILKKDGIEACVINSRFLKPFDEKTICENLSKLVVTIEDGSVVGGLGSNLEEIIVKNNLYISLKKIAYPDEFIKHGDCKQIEEKYRLDTKSIVEEIKDTMKIKSVKYSV